MIGGRRSVRARHEFRFGRREALALGGACCLIAAVVFGVGVLVGRGLGTREAGLGLRAEAEARAEQAPPRPVEPAPAGASEKERRQRPAPPSDEKLTFYETLTAPTIELPPPTSPRVEERLVPREESAAEAPRAPSRAPDRPAVAEAPERPRPAPERRSPPAAARPDGAVARLAARPERAVPPPPPPPARRAAPRIAPVPINDPEPWTVQVSSFRSRALADELRARLAARGFPAYVLTSTTEDGQTRYRVRVGAFAQRPEAERVAADLRTERGLNPIVTSRAR